MSGINEAFSDNPQFNVFGTVTGTGNLETVRFPAHSAKLLRFKANPDNEGNFLIGVWGTNLTHWPMAAGDDTGWIAPPTVDRNEGGLNSFIYQGQSGSVDFLHWWIQR